MPDGIHTLAPRCREREPSTSSVVEWWLQVPIAGSRVLFFGGSCFYVFTVAALGILLGTIAATMGQFGLLCIPVLLVMMLLSRSTTPMESMPVWLQYMIKVISDAAFRGFRSRCALSWSGPFDRLAGHFGDGRYRQCLFRFCLAPLSPRHFQRLNPVHRFRYFDLSRG